MLVLCIVLLTIADVKLFLVAYKIETGSNEHMKENVIKIKERKNKLQSFKSMVARHLL